MVSEVISNITEENFDELVFENKILTIVLFGAKRCSICNLLMPVLEQIYTDYGEKLAAYSVDVDENEALAQRFRLKGIPTLLFFRDGEIKNRITGFYPKVKLEENIKKLFKE